MLYESTIEIERPIDEVFEVATCMRRCVAWQNTRNSRPDSDEPTRVGSTITQEYRLLGRSYVFKTLITELSPPLSFAFKTIEGFKFSALYTFTPTEQGTRFYIAYKVKELVAPIRGTLEGFLLKKVIEKIMLQEQKQLKILMEGDVDLWTLTPPLPSA